MLEYVNVDFKALQPYTPAIVQDQGLPEPTSSLSNFVPPKAIESASTIFDFDSCSEVSGKRAAEHGVTA